MIRRKFRRRAFSLVEMMCILFCTLLLTAVAISLLHHVNAWGSSIRNSSNQAASIDRMEQSLRRQLRQATDVQPAGATLTITTTAGRSQWQLADDACQTTWTENDGSSRRERYKIGPYSNWQVTTSDGLTTVLLEVSPDERGMPLRVVEPIAASPLESTEGEGDE